MLSDILGLALIVLLVAFPLLAIFLNYLRHRTADRGNRAALPKSKPRKTSEQDPVRRARPVVRLGGKETRNPERR